MSTRSEALDQVLSGAVASKELPCVVAGAWTDDAEPYVGAFGSAREGVAMATNTVVWIASMTKAVTAVAAMQQVDSGAITLDEPLGDLVPYLGRAQVLVGFDGDGVAQLRPPATPITLRNLLTHSSGFGYGFTSELLARFDSSRSDGERTGAHEYEAPLLFDPGERWAYGIGIDWAGKVVEAVTGRRLDAVIADEICAPLGMLDSGFARTDEQRERSADVHVRNGDAAGAGFTAIPFELPANPDFVMGGGGMYSTVPDYLRFTRMILGGGALDGVRVLAPETVAMMSRNHIVGTTVAGWASANPAMSNDVALDADGPQGWGLSFLVNEQASPEGRSAGSLSWAGLANSYYWIDPTARTTGVFATQLLPFYDDGARRAFRAFETVVAR